MPQQPKSGIGCGGAIVAIACCVGLYSCFSPRERPQASRRYDDSELSRPAPTPATPKSVPAPRGRTPSIEVKSLNVKKIDGQYRYFFSIQNLDGEGYQGSVTISLINAKGEVWPGRNFTSSQTIPAGGGRVVYYDQQTGPPDVHGDYGITRFSGVAEQGGARSNAGGGDVIFGGN